MCASKDAGLIQVVIGYGKDSKVMLPYPFPGKGWCEICPEPTYIDYDKSRKSPNGNFWKHFRENHSSGRIINNNNVYCVFDGFHFKTWSSAESHFKENHKGCKYTYLVKTEGKITKEESQETRMEMKDFLVNPILGSKAELESQVEIQHQPAPDHRQQQKSVFEKYVQPNSTHISQLMWGFITVYDIHGNVVSKEKPKASLASRSSMNGPLTSSAPH